MHLPYCGKGRPTRGFSRLGQGSAGKRRFWQATWSEENPDGRWRVFSYEELMARDKVNLDIFWLRDESLEDSANLPDPDVLALEIVEELKAALEQFGGIIEGLGEEDGE
jgi:type I restriction enzyme M protein